MSQNFGNKVEPNWGSRFQATAVPMVDLYKIDKKEKKVTFVTLVTEKGKSTEIFGKINSKLYQGAWRHGINIEGNPMPNLGVPLNQISADRTIIRGSDDEKAYFANIEKEKADRKRKQEIEKKRKADELRKNIANAKNLLIGTWKFVTKKKMNFFKTYKSDGTVFSKMSGGGAEIVETWRIEGDTIHYAGIKKRSTSNSEWKSDSYKSMVRLIYIDKNLLTYITSRGDKVSFMRVK